MSYKAIITPIVNIRPHSNADRLVLGTAAGHQVIVSKDTPEGTMGIFFPSDGQLSLELCKANNLHRDSELNENPKAKGFFDSNRRVRAQKFRGEISEGFWVELKILKYTNSDLSKLKQGDLISDINGIPVCNKYYTPATIRAMNHKKKTKISKKGFKANSFVHFAEHWHTNKLRMTAGMIPKGAILSISEKCHGTSARTGYMIQKKQLNWFKNLWNKTIGKTGLAFKNTEYKYVSGTRRVVLNPKEIEEIGYYSGKRFRAMIHQKIKDIGLAKGETIFYEIVGYDEAGSLIMGSHNIKDEKLKKKYGNQMVYTYGCKPTEFKVLVYRITQTTPDGHVVEVPWTQMINRCKVLGLDTVPQLQEPFIYTNDREGLFELCEKLSNGNSVLDDSHIREGVVVRVEAPGIDTHMKYKSFWFCELEEIKKNSNDYVDPEEIA